MSFIQEKTHQVSGIGAILNLPIYRELYAIFEAMAKFKHYIYFGNQLIIRTDNQSLMSLPDQTIQTPEQI